jgi:hypothetical protein
VPGDLSNCKLGPMAKSSNPRKPTLAIDFDGVIRGVDGSVVEGCEYALQRLRTKFKLVLYTCRHADFFIPWLKEHDLLHYFEWFYGVDAGKPRADVYLDDKGLRFLTWEQALLDLYAA